MNVRTLLASKNTTVVVTSADATVRSAVHQLRDNSIGALVVTDGPNQRVIGIISERDVVRGLARFGTKILNVRVADLMSADVITCTQDTSLKDVMRIMNEERIRHLPITDGHRLSGIVSIGDVVRFRLQDLELEVWVMHDLRTGQLAANASNLA
jgi:CBS domain-containing protein